MKRNTCYALSLGLLVTAGCGREKTSVPERPAEEPKPLIDLARPVRTAEATIETTEKRTEEALEVIESTTRDTVQAAQAEVEKAADAITARAEGVLAELSQPLETVKEKVTGLGTEQLMAQVDGYKAMFLEKKEQLAVATGSLAALSPMELIGEKGKVIKEQIATYTGQLTALKERYTVYLDQLKAMGTDISSLVLQ